MIDRLPGELLGRHVARLALDAAGARARQPARGVRDAEVAELDRAVLVEHHVRRRDVAMHDAPRLAAIVDGGVDGVQAAQHLADDVERHRQRQRAPGTLRAIDRRSSAAHVLHDDVEDLALAADVEHLHHARVHDGAGDARLVEQHVDELRLAGELRQQHLDRHVALEAAERLHARAEDLGHAAAADALDQRVAVEAIPHL